MSATAALFARTFVIGIAVAAPVGAMGVLCIQRTLARGWWAGLATGAGIATADATYAAFAAFGVAAVSTAIVTLQSPLRIVGGIALVWLGWRAMVAPPAREPVEQGAAAGSADAGSADAGGSAPRGRGAMYVGAVGLTLTNPMTIMAFAAVFASAGLGTMDSARSAVVATAGVASGSFAWWLALASGVALVRHAFSDRAMLWVNCVSGAVIVVFGLVALTSGVMALR